MFEEEKYINEERKGLKFVLVSSVISTEYTMESALYIHGGSEGMNRRTKEGNISVYNKMFTEDQKGLTGLQNP